MASSTSLRRCPLTLAACALVVAAPAWADPFSFSTGTPDGLLASSSRPAGTGMFPPPEFETADDFVLGSTTSITSASFTGLLTQGVALSSILAVNVEIYRVFPLDSTVPPGPNVPTRVNSPSDVALLERSSDTSGLTFSTTTLAASFTAANSVDTGVHPLPGQFTGGEGAVRGMEVRFDVSFTAPILLGADHYFFVPQVQLASGEFLWLSAPKPIVAPGTPFLPDLQSWIRSSALDPDWLRLGTDITHQGPFNAAFSLAGETVVTSVPEPETYALMLAGLLAGAAWSKARAKRSGLS